MVVLECSRIAKGARQATGRDQQASDWSQRRRAAPIMRVAPIPANFVTEVTIGLPGFPRTDGLLVQDVGYQEFELWGPETLYAMPGAAAFMNDENCIFMLKELFYEAENEAYHRKLRKMEEISTELDEWREIDRAHVQWCGGNVTMDDLHEPSYFSEWNQALGGGIVTDKMFTPEMLAQRDALNWHYNFKWNSGPDGFDDFPVPDTTELLELVAVGDNHGVAKCVFGAIFVPKSALTHLYYNGGAEVGTIFDGEITFTPHNKFPWRLKHNGVTFTYEDMCGTRRPDDY